ncbi:cytochrome b6-f complex iron-sulfur subunit [Methanobrevibacter cuticularis]|uniref:Cytochrome b6-f complex iron-sulfur subunit n=1 Tax=Methanobrevibacter cuticularis TaxID=47311 RepID=A0A166D9A0_9EURY|nr:Rieske 2Fe-2S domain-containing protein [Methanobrevibacter cuticularis]KZX15340.1 cytochrome b6-f complex iron-sulfur subunit [Methanobrevibacter cuticularis]
MDVESFEYFWTGGDNISQDLVPVIGETSQKGVYIATGFSSWGMTTGTIITDLILKRENSYSDIFSPLRFKNKISQTEKDKIAKFSGESPIHWKSLKDNLFELKNDEAKVVEFEDKTIAIYKDSDSNLFALNGKCTHRTCNLRWNTAEKKWECPCHGAIFNHKGEVVYGPAIKNLERLL